jgi:hypothetical protein
MKFTKCITFTAVASFTMVGAITQAAAQEANARAHQLTTSLKIDVEGEEEVKNKDNGDSKWSQKVITQKVSNKEILEALVDAGVINDIKGWSIVLSSNDSAEVTGTWITKKKNTPINISEFFNANATDDLTISSYKGKFSGKKDEGSEKGAITALSKVTMDIDGAKIEVDGTVKVEYTANFFGSDGEGEAFITKATFENLSGIFSADEDDEGLVTGSLKVKEGKRFTDNN